MKFTSNLLCIEFSDLAEAGFDLKNVSSYIYKNVKGWQGIDDPADKRKTLVPYENMTDAAKQQIKARFGDPYQYIRSTAIKSFLKTDSQAFNYYSDYKVNGEHLSTRGKNGEPGHIQKYTLAAEWLNMLLKVSREKKKFFNGLGFDSKGEFYDACVDIIKAEAIDLPHNYARLLEKMRKYESGGYRSLISAKFGNDNSMKITEEIGNWLIAQYQLPIKIATPILALKYLGEAKQRGWEPLTEQAIYNYLNKPENVQKWYAGRNGLKLAVEEFGYSLRTDLPTFRDALWYSDGTGLNYVGQKDGKWLGMHQMYCIVDCYSEMILGWAVSKTENHDAQIKATQMAIRNAMAKPFEWRYDNQGGHKKAETQEFFKKVTAHHFFTQPNNGKSKTIESIFGRFQSTVMRQDWFFSGQNRTAKKTDSKANMEFLLENLKACPTLDQITSILTERIEEWNNLPHPKTGIARKQMYQESVNPKHQPVDYLEMVDMFWLTSERPVTYRNDGLKITIARQTHEYEVIENGMPDMNFRSKHIGDKFFVKYDHDDLSHVRLYLKEEDGSLRFVSIAEPRITVPRALVDHQEGDMQRIKDLLSVRKQEKERMEEQGRVLEEVTGVRKSELVKSYGQFQKEVSNESDPALQDLLYGQENTEFGKPLEP